MTRASRSYDWNDLVDGKLTSSLCIAGGAVDDMSCASVCESHGEADKTCLLDDHPDSHSPVAPRTRTFIVEANAMRM